MNVPESCEPNVAEMGIALLPQRLYSPLWFGHMWLYWRRPEKEENPPYRGYYPVDIPPAPENPKEHKKWLREIIKLLAHESVQGRYEVDYEAKDAMAIKAVRKKMFIKKWKISQNQLIRLENRCCVSEDGYVLEGAYSWVKNCDEWDNCSSWVMKVVNYVMQSDLLICKPPESPKRLENVKKAISWDYRGR